MKVPTLACLLMAWPMTAAAAQVTLSASTQNATIAEPIELRVVVRADARIADVRIDVPAGAYDIIGRSRRPTVKVPGFSTFEEIITIAFFKTGEFPVGPFAVELLPVRGSPEQEQTGQLSVRIRSLLTADDRDIKPLKKLLPLRGDLRHLLPYAAAVMTLMLLGATGWLLLKKVKTKRLAEAAPLLPPEVELEMRLRELRQKNLPQQGEFRQFFIALSDMIKHFIERAYGFNAADLTTTETVTGLEKSERDAEVIAHMESIFRLADLVKFARQVPGQDAIAGLWQKITALIATHKERREAAMAEAHAQTGR